MTNESGKLPVRVAASSGQTRDDGWIGRRLLPLKRRLVEAGLMAAVGLLAGAGLLLIPLVHIFGVLFAIGMNALAATRLRAAAVLDGAGGTCPRCGYVGQFFAGFGRRRFRLPITASCGGCGVELTLHGL